MRRVSERKREEEEGGGGKRRGEEEDGQGGKLLQIRALTMEEGRKKVTP